MFATEARILQQVEGKDQGTWDLLSASVCTEFECIAENNACFLNFDTLSVWSLFPRGEKRAEIQHNNFLHGIHALLSDINNPEMT